MEQKAIEVYGERAENAGDEQEKALYLWLSNWEESHLKVLIDIEKEVTEQVWFDNQFWPM